jgi:general secretion pathway protein H
MLASASPGRCGFSLIEMIVVIVVIGVAAGLIVPRMDRSIGSQELRESSARLAYTAQTVRELAVSMQRVCALEIDLDRGGYGVLIQSNDDSSEKMRAVQASWLKKGRVPEGIKLAFIDTQKRTENRTGTCRLKFHPDGTSDGGMIVLMTRDDERLVIAHAHSGRIVSADPDSDAIEEDFYDLGD